MCDIVKTLLKTKNAQVKNRLMMWLRKSVGLNLELMKTMTQEPVASQGFVLNMISLLLLLCKPFTSNFEKYKGFFEKINPAYLMTDRFVDKVSGLDKIETVPD